MGTFKSMFLLATVFELLSVQYSEAFLSGELKMKTHRHSRSKYLITLYVIMVDAVCSPIPQLQYI